MRDSYFDEPEVSNSDLSELKKYFMPEIQRGDIEKAYRFGTLVDAIITEPHKVDHFKLTVGDYNYSSDEFEIAKQMLKAFRANAFCAQMVATSNFQTVMKDRLTINFEGFEFELNARCKWDIWMQSVKFGGDIKSTAATSQKQFEDAIEYFDYDRQRAWYMDISKSSRDFLIGISKINFKVFIVPITRESRLYKQGLAKYRELAFKYWTLFEGILAPIAS